MAGVCTVDEIRRSRKCALFLRQNRDDECYGDLMSVDRLTSSPHLHTWRVLHHRVQFGNVQGLPYFDCFREVASVKPFLTFLFFVVLANISAAQMGASKAAGKCVVEGKVIQEPGGQPLKKTTITLIGHGQEQSLNYSAITDAEGSFKIEGLNPGRYNVTLERAGFVEGKRGGHDHNKSLLVQPGEEVKKLVLRMQAAAVVTGKILDTDGDPMPNVSVNASRYGSTPHRWQRELTGFAGTNDLGEYRMSGLAPGRYLISATAPGTLHQRSEPEKEDGSSDELVYTTTYYPGTADKTQAVPIEIHAGEEIPINFALVKTRAFRVRGTVAKVRPGNFAQVMLRSRSDGDARMDSKTAGIDGSFEFQSVLPGSYTLMLLVVSVPDVQMANSGQTVIEVSNSDVSGVRLEPVPSSQVRGRFRMDSNQKIDWSQLTVFLSPEDKGDFAAMQGNQPTFSQVKNDGSFEIKNVPAGTYQLVVGSSNQELRDYITNSVNLEGKDVSDSGFTVSGTSYALDVVVSAHGGTIEGKVLDGNDHLVPYATVVCVPSPEHRKRPDSYQQDTTDEKGHFSLRGLNPGEYTVLAWEDLQDDYRDPEFLKLNEARGQSVRLDEGDRKTVSVKVIPSSDE